MNFDEATEKIEQWQLSVSPTCKLIDINVEEEIFTIEYLNISFTIRRKKKEQTETNDKWRLESVANNLPATISRFLKKRNFVALDEILNFLSSETTDDAGNQEDEQTHSVDGDCNDDDVDGDNDDDDDAYYPTDDVDDDGDAATNSSKKMTIEDDKDDQVTSYLNTSNRHDLTVNRIYRDLKILKELNGKFGISGKPRDDDIFIWDIKLTDIPKDSSLGSDLRQYAKRYNQEEAVIATMTFPQDYPYSPPFFRIIRPKFTLLSGNVTVGGSVCMELLTKSGWSPAYDVESLLVQIRAEILSDNTARLDLNCGMSSYAEKEAKDAFLRVVQTHGWKY